MKTGNVTRFQAIIGIVFLVLLPSISTIVSANRSAIDEYNSFFLPIPLSGDHQITRGSYIDNNDWVIAALVVLGKTDTHEYDGIYIFHLEKGLIGSLIAIDAYSVAVSAKKNLLLIGGKDYLRAYSLDSLKELWEEKLGISVRRIELSPDNNLAAIVGNKGGYIYVYIMSINDRKILGYKRVYEEVKILKWSPDSDKLLVLTDGYGYVLNKNGKTIWSASEAPLPIDAKWSSTGKYFGIVNRRGIMTLFDERGKKLWSLSKGAAIAFIGDDLVLIGYRKSIKAVSTTSGKIKWSINNLEFQKYIEAAESLENTAIFISSSGKMVIVDKNGEKKYPSMPISLFKSVKASRGAYVVFSYSLDAFVVSPSGEITKRLHLLIGSDRALTYTGSAIYITAYSLDNTYYAYKLSLSDDQLTVKELNSNEKEVVIYVDDNRYFVRSYNGLKYVVNGKEVATISVPQPYLQKIVLSPNKRYLLLIPAGIIYSLESGEKILSIGKADKYIWSPDSRLVVRLYGYYIGIYDLDKRGQLYSSDMGELGKTRTASWSNDSRHLAIVRERGVEIYRVKDTMVEKAHTLKLNTEPVAAFWTSNGGVLAILQYNKTIKRYFIEFYDTRSWNTISDLELGDTSISSIKRLSGNTVVYLTRLAKGSDKYTIGIVLIDLEKKRVKTIDTGVYTYSKYALRLYPLSSSTLIIYEEKKGITLVVSNTRPIQRIVPGKIAISTTTSTTTLHSTTSPASATTQTAHKSATTANKATTNTTVSSTPETSTKTSQTETKLSLQTIIAIVIAMIIIAMIAVLKKK